MARIAGVDLPDEKRLDIALTYIYGMGKVNVGKALKASGMDAARRVKTLSDEEVNRIARVIDKQFTVEGDLRQEIGNSIKRLKEINSYRGVRHTRGLPARGQRTRSNARTRRGKRVTIGAMKKQDRAKMTTPAPAK
jgi:small subunit ribosomal protein S13